MIGYPFIANLFKSIFDKSTIIGGRFTIGTAWGGEINEMDIETPVNALPAGQKYPCAIMYPAVTVGAINDLNPARHMRREMYILFATNAKTTGQNAISKPAQNLQSQHTIPETWYDMERCAIGFMRVLQQKIMEHPDYTRQFDIDGAEPPQMQTVTKLGNDEVSGVLLKFTLLMATDCGYADYENTIDTIVLPDPNTDPHPIHTDL